LNPCELEELVHSSARVDLRIEFVDDEGFLERRPNRLAGIERRARILEDHLHMAGELMAPDIFRGRLVSVRGSVDKRSPFVRDHTVCGIQEAGDAVRKGRLT